MLKVFNRSKEHHQSCPYVISIKYLANVQNNYINIKLK